MHYNQVDLLYQHALKYYHHAENYQQSILQDITPFGLRLKEKAAINPICPDFNSQWNGILKDAEQDIVVKRGSGNLGQCRFRISRKY